MIIHSSTVAFVLSATAAWASQICSPDTCLDGKSSSTLLAHASAGSRYLSPGTYTESSFIDLDFDPNDLLNFTHSLGSETLTILPPSHPVGFTKPNYFGDAIVWGDSNWRLDGWKSVYLLPRWYGILEGGKVIWGAVPNKGELPNELIGLKLIKAASSACDPPCSSHGVCAVSNATAACECAPGWTGKGCDQCATGYWGPSCTAGPTNCTIWDDGLTGTGACLGTASSSTSTCNCEHGTCSSSTECVCAAGWTTNSTTWSSFCNTCAEGFFQDSHGNCLSCPLGCDRCSLQTGSDETPTCLSCKDGLSLSSASPATCSTSAGGCSDGTYYDETDSTCKSCSPACSTCTGPSPFDCLSCASPRVNLQGQCVYFDASNGVCDSSLSALDGVFVVNNAKNKCDACPAGCLDCHIPGFSNVKGYDELQCSSCQEGWLLQDNTCVKSCEDGWFLPIGSASKNGTCERCDSTCTTCQGTSTTCTSCPSPLFALAGSCAPSASCSTSTTPVNGTCQPCLADCESCSSPVTCSSCPSSRPVLSNGRCNEYCPQDQYFDVTKGSCQSCDWHCASCSSSGDKACTSCPDQYLPKGGECISVKCESGTSNDANQGDNQKQGQGQDQGGFVAAYGVCLSSLTEKEKKKWPFSFVAIGFLVFLAIGIGFRIYVNKERKKTREATREFADKLDEREVEGRLRILRLERVLGLERVRIGLSDSNLAQGQYRSESGEAGGREGKYEDGRKRRFKDLLLPSRRLPSRRGIRTDREAQMEMKNTNFAINQIRDCTRESTCGAPPPPYAPSTTSSGTSPTHPEGDRKVRPDLPQTASTVSDPHTTLNITGSMPGSRVSKARRDSLDSIPTPVLGSFISSPITRTTDMGSNTETAFGFRADTVPKTKYHSMSNSSTPSESAHSSNSGGLMPPPRPGMGLPRVPSYGNERDRQRELRRSVSSTAHVRELGSDGREDGAQREKGGDEDQFERRLRDLWPALNRRKEEGWI